MATISGWSEAIMLSIAFVAVLGIIIGAMNHDYNKNYDVGLSTNASETAFIEYQSTAQTQVQGGEVDFNADQGITLKSSYGLAKDAINIVWQFIGGGWIETLASYWNVGEAGMLLAKAFRIIYFLSAVFALLYALFKVAF